MRLGGSILVVVFVDLREYVGRTWVEKEVVWVGVDVGLGSCRIVTYV